MKISKLVFALMAISITGMIFSQVIEYKSADSEAYELDFKVMNNANLNPTKYISKGRYQDFYNYVFYLLPNNIILPGDSRSPDQDQTSNYRDDVLDEKSVNFKYGQFSIYIESKNIAAIECNGIVEIRMPQTLKINGITDSQLKEYIKEKQDLYYKIKSVAKNGSGFVKIIIEPHSRCLGFFRAANGKYINYEGQYKN